MAAVIFPWPTRAERRARVEAAREGMEKAREKTEQSYELQRELRQILVQNHFVQTIAEGFMHGQKQHRPRDKR